jgi:hypothetical protein
MFVSCVKQDNVLSNNARSHGHLELGKKKKGKKKRKTWTTGQEYKIIRSYDINSLYLLFVFF